MQLSGLLPTASVWILALYSAQPLCWHGDCGHRHLHTATDSGPAPSDQSSTGLGLAECEILLLASTPSCSIKFFTKGLSGQTYIQCDTPDQ